MMVNCQPIMVEKVNKQLIMGGNQCLVRVNDKLIMVHKVNDQLVMVT